MRKSLFTVAAVGFLGVACGSSSDRTSFDTPGNEDPNTGVSGGQPGTGSITGDGSQDAGIDQKAEECTKMDIVFVVDDSGSMDEEQSNLAQNFPQFVNVLNNYKTKSGSTLDWRIAVTTTGRDEDYTVTALGLSVPTSEKGDNGAFRNTSACGVKNRWVSKDEPNAASEFSCLAKVGTNGPSYEMPLECAKLSLVDRVNDGTNAGFLRPDALLGLVIITDEDDCSRSDNNFTYDGTLTCEQIPGNNPVGEYANQFDTVAKGHGRWAVAAIAGDGNCHSSFGDAQNASRLKQFVSLAGGNGAFASICDGDLTKGLQVALETFDGACKSFPAGVH